MALTKQYLEDHIPTENTEKMAELGRQFATMLMKEAAAQIGDKSVDTLNLKADITLEENVANVCVGATVCFPFIGCQTVHVNVG